MSEVSKKEKNPQGAITINEAMEYLKGKFHITKTGIRKASICDGFRFDCEFERDKKRKKYTIDEQKFKKWIKEKIDIVPQGFRLVSDCAKELGISSAYVYMLIKKYEIKTKKGGVGKGKLYIDFSILKKYFEQNKRAKK